MQRNIGWKIRRAAGPSHIEDQLPKTKTVNQKKEPAERRALWLEKLEIGD